jgi:hypothetical protein
MVVILNPIEGYDEKEVLEQGNGFIQFINFEKLEKPKNVNSELYNITDDIEIKDCRE